MNEHRNLLCRHHKYLRYLLLLSLITFVILFVATTAHGAWYNANWQYRKQITIQGSRVSGGAHSSFPVLIKLASDTDLAAHAQNDGDDILFTSSDEVTKIPHEIENFNGTTGELVAWVKVSLNANPTDTTIYMYYGYGSATNQENATSVWDNNYVGVWHLKEDPSGTAPQMKDSTTNGNHGTSTGSMTSGDQVTGKIGGALDFDGSNDEIRFSSAMLGDRTAYTITAWMQTGGDGEGFYSEGELSTDDYLMIRKDNYKLDFYLENPPYYPNFSGGTLGSSFHHVAIVQTSKSARASFVNGASKTSNGTNAGTVTSTYSSIGLVRTKTWNCCEFSGIIDEVRVSNIARSDDWIKTSYNNQVWPNTAVTPSPLPSPNPGGGFITVYGETTSGGGNSPPSVDAGADDSVTLPDAYNLDGTANDGGDGPSLTVTWSKQSGPGTVTFGNANAQDTTADFSTAGTYVLRLTADDGVDTAYDEVTITVSTNTPPNVDAGADDSVTLPAAYNLNGTADDGGDGPSSLTVTWTARSGPGTVTFGNASLQDTTADFSTDGTYVLRLTADDGADTAYDEVTITVYPDGGGGGGNTPPNVDAGTNGSVTLPDVYNLDGTADDGGDGPSSLTYSWTKQSGPGTVTFGNATAEDTTAAFDTAGTYVLRLTVDDGADTRSDDVSITVYAAGGTPPPIGDYSCNLKITILGSQVQGGPHDDFPVLISLTDDSLKNTGCGVVTDSNGYDILFTDASKTTQLDHEIEKFDAGAGAIIAWVRVDLSVSPNNTVIYMYYGNASAGDQQNITGVWDSNYVGVWHLKEDPTDAAPEFNDSTSNGNDGSAQASMDSADQVSGQIDGSIDFDGTDDMIEVPSSSSLNPSTAVTVEAWISVTDTGDQDRAFVVKGDGTIDDNGTNPYAYALWSEGNSACDQIDFCINDVDNDGANCVEEASAPGLCGSGWHHLVGTYDGTALRLFIDGSAYQTKALAGATITRGTSYPVVFGRDSLNGSKYTGGTFDEVRISKVARSGDWITTEYNNQSDPSSFYSVEKHCASPAPPIAEFTCSIPITIDSSKVSGTSDLTDFPVLISLTNIGLRTASGCGYVQSSEGYDIIFSDASKTTVLDHEIEEYDSISGKLVAWVRVPTLSATYDTTIYIHFGHSYTTCGATENPTGVWDASYQGVWHLNESSGTRYDSTSHSNELSDINTVSSGTGKIGVGADFESSNSEKLQRTDPGAGDSLDMTGSITFTAWVNSQSTESPQTILGKWREPPCTSDDPPYQLRISDDGVGNQRLAWLVASDCTTGDTLNGTYGNLTMGSWKYVAVIYDDSAQELVQYVNDSLVAGPLAYTSGGPYDSGGNFQLGARASGQYLDGMLDEARISNTVRSADWIKTSYNNQSDPSSFYSVGASGCLSLSGFSCDRKITIDSSKVAGSSDLINFPVLFKIQNDCNLKTEANGGNVQDSNGLDIMFTDSDGVTQLDHEIEKYDGTTGDLTAWVKVPTLPYNSDKDIYMYYGSDLTCDPSNPTGVWDSNYVAVWHLDETSGDHADSTSNNNTGTPSGGVNQNGTGQIEGADVFDGSSGKVEAPDYDILNAITVSAWINWDGVASNTPGIVSKRTSTEVLGDWDLRFENDGRLEWMLWSGADSSQKLYSNTALSSGELKYVVVTFDESTDTAKMYIDDASPVTSTSFTNNLADTPQPISIGWGGQGSQYFGGTIDELRLSKVARSAGWIETEYNNQSDPDSFYSMSEDSCSGSYGFNYQYCKKITVDHTQVNSDLTNFPLLVNLTNDDDLKTVANGGRIQNSQGWDMVFRTPACGNMDHEIEKYDGSTGDLVAWVQVPTLSSSVDTEIYMYYGANVNCTTENPSGVWDSNYKGVWHMKDLGTPGTGDSTSYSNDGTKKAAGEPAEVDENIGKAQDFGNDGTADEYIDISSAANDVDVNAGTFELWLKREFADGAPTSSYTIDERISYDEDDSEETISSGSIDWGSSDLELGEEGSAQIVGMRWRNITIPQGATITSAYIEFTVDEVQTGTPANVTFYGEAADNAAAFENVAYNISSAHYNNPTSASVAWNNIPGWDTVGQTKQSPDIATIIQEIVDRPGWVSGNALVVLVTGSGRRTADSHDSSPSTAPLLHVEYEIPSGVSTTMSIMRVDTDAENGITFTYDQAIEKFRFRHEAGNTDVKVERASSEIPLNTWTHASMTWDKNAGASGELKAYINGSQVGTTLTGLGTWVGSATYGNLGRKYDDTEYYEGSLDEARISNVARSADWIQTQYINQSDPGNFYTVGSCFEPTTEVTEGWEEEVQ